MRVSVILALVTISVVCGVVVLLASAFGDAQPQVLKKLELLSNSPDSTQICLWLTPEQQSAYPLVQQPMCRMTVGDLRRRELREVPVSLGARR